MILNELLKGGKEETIHQYCPLLQTEGSDEIRQGPCYNTEALARQDHPETSVGVLDITVTSSYRIL